MKPRKLTVLTPTRVAAWTTSILLIVGGAVTIGLYQRSLYQPLLLLGLLQIFPAVVNLLLFLPILKKREKPAEPPDAPPEAQESGLLSAEMPEQPLPPQAFPEEPLAAQAQADVPPETDMAPEDSADGYAQTELAPPSPPKPSFGSRVKCLCGRAGWWLYDFWVERRSILVSTLVLVTILIFGIQYWNTYSEAALPGLLDYLIPVALVVLFVAYIVLDKWCKHTAARVTDAAKEGEDPDRHAAAIFDRAVLNSLRGALSVARLALVFAAAIIMLRKLDLVYWDVASGVVITVLFYYQLVFMVISLAVRFIRRELPTAPELSIPMPGLGGEDLGILAYLEKNTGITMRSLWSIRLAGKIVPYAAMSIVLLLWLFSGVVKIEANQQGALYRLGVLQEEPLEPGLHMTLPWPFDSVEVYDTEVVNEVTIGYISDESADNFWTCSHGTEEYRLILGNGNELVSINMRVEFVIDDLYTYLTGSAAPESLMQAAAYELITAKTISTDLATLLTADRVVFTEDFKAELIERTELYNTGLRIVNVVLESIHPPVEVADIYQAIVNKKIEAQQIEATALGAAQVEIIQAKMNRDAIIKDAEITKAADIAVAQAAVAELLGHNAADSEHGEAYRYYLYLNALREAYSDGRIILIGDGVNPGNIYIGSLGSK